MGKDITDPLYLPLKRGGPVCPLLESPLECLVDVYKTLSINFSASKQTASPPLGETGEGFHNVELCIFEITDPLYLPLKWGGPVCPYLEGPLEWFANCIFIQLRCKYPMHKNRRWI